jgi:hypothetical protein
MFFNPSLSPRLAAPLLASLLLAATVAGCRTKPVAEPAASGSGSGTGLPVSAPAVAPKTGTLAAQQGPVQLTDAEVVARFEANAFRKGLRPTAKDALMLADDQRVIRLFAGDQLVARRAGALAEAKGCSVSAEQARAAMQSEPEVSRLFALDAAGQQAAFAPYNMLSMETLETVFADELLRKCLEEKLAAGLDEPTLRARVLAERETIEMQFASVRLPLEAGRLSAVLTTRAADIEKRYAETSDQHWLPPRRRISLVRQPKPADTAALEALKEQMRGWREGASASPEAFAATAIAHSADASASSGGRYGLVTETQMPLVFTTPVGATTALFESETDLMFARVEEQTAPERRPLDDGMRSEIAATLARESGPTDKEKALAATVQQAMVRGGVALEAIKSEKGVVLAMPKPFRRTATGMVPGVGPNPALSAQLFAMLSKPGDTFPEPYFTGYGLVVVKLIARVTPTESEIATALAEQREETAAIEAREQVDALLAADSAKPVVMVEPISALLRAFATAK